MVTGPTLAALKSDGIEGPKLEREGQLLWPRVGPKRPSESEPDEPQRPPPGPPKDDVTHVDEESSQWRPAMDHVETEGYSSEVDLAKVGVKESTTDETPNTNSEDTSLSMREDGSVDFRFGSSVADDAIFFQHLMKTGAMPVSADHAADRPANEEAVEYTSQSPEDSAHRKAALEQLAEMSKMGKFSRPASGKLFVEHLDESSEPPSSAFNTSPKEKIRTSWMKRRMAQWQRLKSGFRARLSTNSGSSSFSSSFRFVKGSSGGAGGSQKPEIQTSPGSSAGVAVPVPKDSLDTQLDQIDIGNAGLVWKAASPSSVLFPRRLNTRQIPTVVTGENQGNAGNVTAADNQTTLEQLYDAYIYYQAQGAAQLTPILDEMLNYTNAPIMYDAAWEIFSLVSPINVVGPFFNGLTTFSSIENTAGFQSMDNLTKTLTMASHGVIATQYEMYWNKCYDTLNSTGILGNLTIIEGALYDLDQDGSLDEMASLQDGSNWSYFTIYNETNPPQLPAWVSNMTFTMTNGTNGTYANSTNNATALYERAMIF